MVNLQIWVSDIFNNANGAKPSNYTSSILVLKLEKGQAELIIIAV